jgi:hypothetical protein
MSCIYFLLVWLDLRTASTVTKLIDKTPQKSKDFLRVSMYLVCMKNIHPLTIVLACQNLTYSKATEITHVF